jgi:hypothetical protein
VSDTGLTSLAAACSGLRHLGLANTEVTDASIILLGEVTTFSKGIFIIQIVTAFADRAFFSRQQMKDIQRRESFLKAVLI